MPDMCNWMVFSAHPTQFITKEEDFHPEFFGTFACPVLRSEPEQLLKEILGNRKLSMVNLNDSRVVSRDADWGMNERLKGQIDDHGYGLSLVKMQAAPIDPV